MYSVTFHGFSSSWAAESFVHLIDFLSESREAQEWWYSTGDSHKGDLPIMIAAPKVNSDGNVDVGVYHIQ